MCAHNVGGTAAAAAAASAANACFCFCFTVYGVSAYVDVVVGDYTKIWRRLKVARHTSHVTRHTSHVTRHQADVVLVSPPWGGPQYAEEQVMAMSTLPCSIASIIAITRHITPNAM